MAPAGGGQAAAGPGYRAERALQPEKLSVDCTELEYRTFLCSWDSYYVASRFALAPVVMQIAYLTNCLATDLLAKLPFDGCVTMVEALLVIDPDYKARNPLTVRRLQFSRCKQGKAETYRDYIVRLEAAHKEADVAIMSPDDIMCLQMLTGCQDAEFLKKPLEVQPCQVEQLKQCAVKYESHKTTAGEIKSSSGHRASKVDAGDGRKKHADVTCKKQNKAKKKND